MVLRLSTSITSDWLGCTNIAKPMPHPRPTRPNTATCEGRRCSHVGATSSFFFFFFTTHSNATQTRDEWGWFTPTRAISGKTTDLGWNSKKRCKTHRLNLITNPKGPKLSHAFSLHSNFSSLSFVSLCCVLSASLSLRHSATQSHTQSHSQLTLTLTRHNLTLNSLTTSPTHSQLTLTLTQSHSNFWTSWNVLVSILWAVFNLWTSCFSYYLLFLLNLVYVYIILKSMLSNILKI